MKKYFPYRFHGIFGQILLLLVCFSLIIGFTFFQLMDRSYKESYRTALLKRGHTDIMEMHSSIESTLSEIRAQLDDNQVLKLDKDGKPDFEVSFTR